MSKKLPVVVVVVIGSRHGHLKFTVKQDGLLEAPSIRGGGKNRLCCTICLIIDAYTYTGRHQSILLDSKLQVLMVVEAGHDVVGLIFSVLQYNKVKGLMISFYYYIVVNCEPILL